MADLFNQQSFRLSTPSYNSNPLKDGKLLLAIMLGLMVANLDPVAFSNSIESTIIEFSHSMLTNRDFLTPQLNGIYFLDQAPLVIWFEAGILALFGETPWVLRLFPVCISIAGVLAIYYLTYLHQSAKVAWISSIILICSPLFFILSHVVNIEITFSILVIIPLLCAWLLLTKNNIGNLPAYLSIAMYILIALSVLANGIIGLIYLLLTISIYTLINSDQNQLRRLWSPIGLVIGLVIILPWLVLSQLAHPGFYKEFLFIQYLDNLVFADLSVLGSIFLCMAAFIVSIFPWGVMFIYNATNLFNNGHPIDNSTKFLFSWICAGVLIFCHLQLHELAILLITIMPSTIITATMIESLELQESKKVLSILIKNITRLAVLLAIAFCVFVVLQASLTILETSMFIACMIVGIAIACSYNNTYKKYGIYGLSIRMVVYNLFMLTVITKYKHFVWLF